MMKGRNNGKKLLAVRIVAHAFEIIHLLTDQNPIQVRNSGASKLKKWLNLLAESRFSSMPLSIPAPVKTQLVLVRKGLFVVKLSMCHRFAESTKLLLSLPLVYVESPFFLRCSKYGDDLVWIDPWICFPQCQIDCWVPCWWTHQCC